MALPDVDTQSWQRDQADLFRQLTNAKIGAAQFQQTTGQQIADASARLAALPSPSSLEGPSTRASQASQPLDTTSGIAPSALTMPVQPSFGGSSTQASDTPSGSRGGSFGDFASGLIDQARQRVAALSGASSDTSGGPTPSPLTTPGPQATIAPPDVVGNVGRALAGQYSQASQQFQQTADQINTQPRGDVGRAAYLGNQQALSDVASTDVVTDPKAPGYNDPENQRKLIAHVGAAVMGVSGGELKAAPQTAADALQVARDAWTRVATAADSLGVDLGGHQEYLRNAVGGISEAPGTVEHARQALGHYGDVMSDAVRQIQAKVADETGRLQPQVAAYQETQQPELARWGRAFLDPNGAFKERIPLSLWQRVTGDTRTLAPNALAKRGGTVYVKPEYAADEFFQTGEATGRFGKQFESIGDFQNAMANAVTKDNQIQAAGARVKDLGNVEKQAVSDYHGALPDESTLAALRPSPGEPTFATGPLGGVQGDIPSINRPGLGRTPVWMQPAAQADPTAPRWWQGSAKGPPNLPSGRSPAGFGGERVPPGTESPSAPLDRALNPPQPAFTQQIENAAGRFLRETYDRIYPLRELDQAAGLPPNSGTHATAQVVSGAIAAGEDNARRFVMPVLEHVGADGPNLERYWVLQASRDVLARYPNSRLPGGINGQGGIQAAERALAAQVGPERFAKIQDAAQQLWKLNDTLRLKPLQDEGIISAQQAMDLRNSNPHYLPFDRYQYQMDDPSHLLPRTSSQLSVSGPGIQARTAGGSEISLDNPMARWTADIIQTQVVVARNRAARSIVQGLQAVEKATGQKLVVVAPEAAARTAELSKASLDRGAISYFDPKTPGVKQVANVPAIYATVAKGLEAETSNALIGVLGAMAQPMRVGNTALSTAFLPVNVIRDMQNAWFREGLSPFSPYYLRGLVAAVAKNTDFSAAAKAGVFQSGLLESTRTVDVLKRAQQLRGITVHSPQDALLVLPRLVAAAPRGLLAANEMFERGPRIGTYLKLQAEGLSELESAVRARDVTADFSKAGNSVRMLNQMVPFLNARVQGGANFLRTIKDNPSRAALMAAPLVFPEVASWLWNQRFPSSALIPQYEYDRNYVFQIGESSEAKDPRNPNAPAQAIPIYIKIPKGDASAVATAPVTAMMRIAFQQGDRSAVDNILHAAMAATQGLAPLDPNASSIVSTVTPPLLATAWQLGTNKDLFRGRPIVPQGEQGRPASEQYDPTIGRTAVALGDQFNVSPRLVQFAIQNYTGGAGQQVQWLLDLGLGALGYNPQAPGSALRQPTTPTENLARLPIVSRFVGTRNTGEVQVGNQNLQEALTQAQKLLYQNPEVRRFGLSVTQVSPTLTVGKQQLPLTAEEQSQYQMLEAQQRKAALDKLVARSSYQGMKTDALKRHALQATMTQADDIVKAQMLRDIGAKEIRARLSGKATTSPGAAGADPFGQFAGSSPTNGLPAGSTPGASGSDPFAQFAGQGAAPSTPASGADPFAQFAGAAGSGR